MPSRPAAPRLPSRAPAGAADAPPLSEPTFLILLSLSSAPRHGYAILKDVERLSDGRIVLGTGTLYGALKRLLDARWIVGVDGGPPDSGRARKTYALTDEGRRVVAAETARLRQLLNAVRRLAGAPA